jgi:cation diffusion facilitator CzcD-associated flavoprotein CzcO
LKKVAKEHDLYKYIKFNHRILSATWEEEAGMWRLQMESENQLISDWCHVLVNGAGALK